MRRPPSSLVPRSVVAMSVVALLAGLGGFALASTTGSTVIRACANKKTGVLRLARQCRHSERAVSWNKEGRTGPSGATGATGAQGPLGPGATSFIDELVGREHEARLAQTPNGLELIGSCFGEVGVAIAATQDLQLFGTVSKDGTLAAASWNSEFPNRFGASGKTEVMFDGAADFAALAIPGPTSGLTHIDVRGRSVGGEGCRFSGMTIPSSRIA